MLIEQKSIDYAYTTFVWSNEAKGQAKVRCVIVGLSKLYRDIIRMLRRMLDIELLNNIDNGKKREQNARSI